MSQLKISEVKTATIRSRRAARHDILRGIQNWRVWLFLAWWDIKMRYDRTLLGPLWITVSMAVFVVSLGILYSQIFNVEIDTYLPYLAAGFLIWNLMLGICNEAVMTFPSAASVISSMEVPYSSHIFRMITRHIIAFLHNVVVVVMVAVYVQIPLSPVMLLAFPGLGLFLVNMLWISYLLSVFGTRYRDIGPIIASIFQLMFFLTPIIWRREIVSSESSQLFVDANPLYHFLDIVRAPLLGAFPDTISYIVSAGFAVVGTAIAYLVFLRFRRRIAYWI